MMFTLQNSLLWSASCLTAKYLYSDMSFCFVYVQKRILVNISSYFLKYRYQYWPQRSSIIQVLLSRVFFYNKLQKNGLTTSPVNWVLKCQENKMSKITRQH